MLTYLKNLLQDRCPHCSEALVTHQEVLCSVKSCPHGHYKEEIYGALGTRLVYHSDTKRV